jgi:predicted PurR-regulated permease PerM
MMIDGLERLIQERAPRLPGWAPLTIAFGLILIAFGLSVYVVAANIASFASELQTYAPRMNGMIADVARAIGLDTPPTLRELFRQANPQRFVGAFVQSIQSLASDTVFILIYLGFLLASRRGFRMKARACSAAARSARRRPDLRPHPRRARRATSGSRR